MGQDNTDLVKRIYGAIGVGDIDAVIGLMADDVEIHFPGPKSVPFTGVFQGHQGVGEFFTLLGSNADVELFEPLEFIAQGDKAVVTGRERLTAKASGRSWETVWAMVWTIRDNEVARLDEYHNTAAIASAFE
jgi:ketosteroid isomerase-like protein